MSKQIIVAIDEIELQKVKHILNSLDPNKCIIKIGSVAYSAIGDDLLTYSANKGFEIFLDLKFHDIPNTVQKCIEGLVSMPINMLTVHISGGIEMLKGAMEAVKGSNIKVFGVTALTSLSDQDTKQIYKRTVASQVKEMLEIADIADIDGVVCSPLELKLVANKKNLLSITPGIRLKHTNDDQKRVMTPKEAISLGADFIVIGRPITSSKNIRRSFQEIYESIQ